MNEGEELKFVRLKTGDDLITQMMEITENDITVYMFMNPLKIVYVPSSKGMEYLHIAFMPWVFPRLCEDQDFMVHAEDIMTMANVSERMKDYYWKNLDYFIESIEQSVKETPEEEQLEISEEESNLEEILEELAKTKRIYH